MRCDLILTNYNAMTQFPSKVTSWGLGLQHMNYRGEHNSRDTKTISVSPACSSGPGTWGHPITCPLTKMLKRTAHVLSLPPLSLSHTHTTLQKKQDKAVTVTSGELPNLMASFPNSPLSIITSIQQAR